MSDIKYTLEEVKEDILEELQEVLVSVKDLQKDTIIKTQKSPYLDEIYSEGYWRGSRLYLELCTNIVMNGFEGKIRRRKQQIAQALNIPNKITIEEYQKMGLDLNRGRTWEYKGFVYLSCYECKEGWCFDKDIVIEGTYGCGCWGCEVD